ncbi:polysaccharide deacetylase family protein [Streptomyces sp. HB132]|uniref:polysaccharide deacetylase family protein n=1 Tax=Streptomyces sp. HB132 TaxID=767388 RepID=UPI00195F748E|nr:polysaccharide deacetylase family protein [Streptomyces sp. HB132]MBM7437105.1 peptidoglycan/xylan/chitin deacetylase (PgdA/CDA1 family) [Streptomyces sp. HB132]
MKRRRTACAVLAALLLGAVASGCADGADEGAGGRRKPVEGQAGAAAPEAPAAAAAKAARLKREHAARVAVAKKWGLAKLPLVAPAPPVVKPRITTRDGFEVEGGESLPPVFTTVPTKERVVFLTMDDGAEKDPELLRMMTELKIPYSAFLSDYVVSDDYGYFKDMQARGVTLNNHTLNHRYLPGLSKADQRREICGEQDKLEKYFGKRPTLFRPPYGNYNADTLRVAGSCGIEAVPLWAAEAFPDHMEWREWDRDLHPGDIILTHFRGDEDWEGSMPDMIRRVMKTVTDKGYAVARLEDYV